MQPLNALDDLGGRDRALGDGIAVHEAAREAVDQVEEQQQNLAPLKRGSSGHGTWKLFTLLLFHFIELLITLQELVVILELTCQWGYPIKSSLQTQRVVLFTLLLFHFIELLITLQELVVILELTCQWEYPIKSSLQTQRVVLTAKHILGRYSIVRKYSTVRIQLVHELTVCQAVSKVLQPGVGGIQDPFTHLSRAFLLVPIMRAQMTELSEQSSVCINIILQPRISKWITRISNYYWRSQFSTNQE